MDVNLALYFLIALVILFIRYGKDIFWMDKELFLIDIIENIRTVKQRTQKYMDDIFDNAKDVRTYNEIVFSSRCEYIADKFDEIISLVCDQTREL